MKGGDRIIYITFDDLRSLIFRIIDECHGPMHQEYFIDDSEIKNTILLILDTRENVTIN